MLQNKSVMNLSDYDNLLTLLRNAVDGGSRALQSAPDWQILMQQARVHGVEPLVYDAALRLPDGQRPDKALGVQMKQVCLYQMQQQTLWLPRIKAAVEALRKASVEPVLLKGFGLADLYPKPYLRSWGDADIWVGIKNYHAGCKALREAFPEAIHHDEEYEELKHYGIVFPDGNAIELHRVAMDFPTPEEEAYWQTLEVPAMTNSIQQSVISNQQSALDGLILTPSEPFNILFVFLHAWEHFCGSGTPLKQILDIALLVQRDYYPLSAEEKALYDGYLRDNLCRFHVQEAWQLIAYVVDYVTGVQLPLYESVGNQRSAIRCQQFLERVLQEGQCRVKEYELGGKDRYDERERVKQLPVWRRKIMTLQGRFANARFLKQYAPAYAQHVLWANIRKGIRRTIRRERMIDY